MISGSDFTDTLFKRSITQLNGLRIHVAFTRTE